MLEFQHNKKEVKKLEDPSKSIKKLEEVNYQINEPKTNPKDPLEKCDHLSKFEIKNSYVRKKLPVLNLSNILFNIFTQKETKPKDFLPNPYEVKILKALMRRKRFPVRNNTFDRVENLNKVVKFSLKKPKDSSMKFVFARTLDHMKKKFFEKKDIKDFENPQEVDNMKQFKDLCFFSSYFGMISEAEGIPIESFYFENRKYDLKSKIPKAITQKLLKNWKKNKEFVKKITSYLQGGFFEDFLDFNNQKIHKMLENCHQEVEKNGWCKAAQIMVNKFDSKGSKLPWTVSEVRHAVKHCLEELVS